MTEARVLPLPLPDQPARDRIQHDLDTNLLVEAGAGSGKTTALVARMTELVATGTAPIDQIAAVTFTRKAAGELRERFQAGLEERFREADDGEERARLDRALAELDRCFIGTIHAFCARILREHPLEVGLDPAFTEVPVEERDAMRRDFWESFLERVVRDDDPRAAALAATGLALPRLYELFGVLVDNPDVTFPARAAEAPGERELARLRAELSELVDRGLELLPPQVPEKGWDSLQAKVRTLAYLRDVTEGWRAHTDLIEALECIRKEGSKGYNITQSRWKGGRSAGLAKALKEDVDRFAAGPEAPVNRALAGWYAHRYALALELAGAAAEEFGEERRRSGRLDFQDLLTLTARLVRGSPGARATLGRRYRRILVDEFQDTDPLQAEIVLLLASDPESGTDWREVVPRPGALFVVGDPKQSIYRFRRADIQLYEAVRERFGEFGDVLELTSNFRSAPPIGDLVNGLFQREGFFPAEATPMQARFEPLNTRPLKHPHPAEGVFTYTVTHGRKDEIARDDAARLAAWIARRVGAGERAPGDFLILTWDTKQLAHYARALEAHGLPLQVTGAGVGSDEELSELMVVLECMVDPSNAVWVTAALTGLFFGFDLEVLTQHRLAGGSLDVLTPGERGHPQVREALGRLHRWWRASASLPADVFVSDLARELGLLPLAASGELAAVRAGAVVFALDVVRQAALGSEASLPGALQVLRAALGLRESEAPFEPGRADVVRLMNLHQAKGLEAPVVVLAAPVSRSGHPVTLHVERGEDGAAVGWVWVHESRGSFRPPRTLARPEGWGAAEAEEREFLAAEDVRLLYVAVTRAAQELVVARAERDTGRSPWAALDPWLDENATPLDLEPLPPEPVAEATLSVEEAERATAEARRRLDAAAEASFHFLTVTGLAKEGGEGRGGTPDAGGTTGEVEAGRFRGYSWGSAVHEALAVAATDPPEHALRAACRSSLIDQGRPLDDHGEPVELDELVELVRGVRASPLWRRAAAAADVMAEVPFAVAGVARSPGATASAPAPHETGETEPDGAGQLSLFAGARPASSSGAPPGGPADEDEDADGVPAILEGVIDLVFREQGGWVVADYKTDVGTDPDFEARLAGYRRQVELYARAWTRLTGEPVKERVLLFTSMGTMEAW